MRKLVALVICLGLALLPAAAQSADAAAATARVDRTQLAPGESLALSVTLQNGEGDVDVTAINDFKVLSQGTSTSLRIVNGATSREVIYNYLLMPQRQGQLTIPALSVTVDGQVLRTEPIAVTVSDQPAAARPPTLRKYGPKPPSPSRNLSWGSRLPTPSPCTMRADHQCIASGAGFRRLQRQGDRPAGLPARADQRP